MKKLFYSEDLKKYYDTEEDCLAAEEEFKKKHEEEILAKKQRADDAKEVEQLFNEANAAWDKAQEALGNFCKKYKSYHFTINEGDSFPLSPIVDYFLNLFNL